LSFVEVSSAAIAEASMFPEKQEKRLRRTSNVLIIIGHCCGLIRYAPEVEKGKSKSFIAACDDAESFGRSHHLSQQLINDSSTWVLPLVNLRNLLSRIFVLK
jgi:hypothetical protein